jgi:hypothetical protein
VPKKLIEITIPLKYVTVERQINPYSGLKEKLSNILKLRIIPSIREKVKDPDRLSGMIAVVFSQLISPFLRFPRAKHFPLSLSILEEICKIPSSQKLWKRDVWDHFMDNRFFPLPWDAFPSWANLMVCGDVERIHELVPKITSIQSANILFGSRETEMIARCQLLRRVATLIWASEMDRHVSIMPALHEKLVDLLLIQQGDLTWEVLLCLRVMVLRFSPIHLTNIWPIVIPELASAFDPAKIKSAAVTRDALLSLIGACQLLDLLVRIRFPEFQMYANVVI